jgi:uncharacterized protein YkwD
MLDAASRSAQLALLNYEGAKGDYQLQGDLKARQEKNEIKIVYNWQVFDGKGTRLGGSSGTKTIPGTGADPWDEVPQATLRLIAGQGIAAVEKLAKPGKLAMPKASAPASSTQSSVPGMPKNSSAAFSSSVQPGPSEGEIVFNASEALRLVNDYRKSKGLNPLTLDSNLTAAATALATEMAKHDRLSHTGPNGADLAKRLKAAGYPFVLAAENLGAGQRFLGDLIGKWKEEPAENQNLLLPGAKQMGIAYRYRPDTAMKTYWTFVIAAPSE